MLVLYVVLFGALNVVQVWRSEELNTHPLNTRPVIRDFGRTRGLIVTADGAVVARSVPTEGRFAHRRDYPEGELFGHVTGYFSFLFGTDGVERIANDALTGGGDTDQTTGLGPLLDRDDDVEDVVLTLRADLQRLARDRLGDRAGSIVVLDPRSGAVLALWSWPTYDPNRLATLDLPASRTAWDELLADPANPLRASAWRDRFFPGSTFKIVTGSAALDAGLVTTAEPVYPVETQWTPPLTTRPVRNFGERPCGGALVEITARSCNTAFARMAVDLGPQTMHDTAVAYGFNTDVPFDLPGAVQSRYPEVAYFDENTPALAQTGFGQNDVAATPLQMALVAAAVANNGVIMRPYTVAEIRDTRGRVVERTRPVTWRAAVTPTVAATMREAMVAVVASGTGTRAAVPGVQVAGKTGTAQTGSEPPAAHAWFIGFAPAEAPRIALAVIIEGQPDAADLTGGSTAAPIARDLFAAALAVTP
jgi:peptidoglycan glycosyltransferase